LALLQFPPIETLNTFLLFRPLTDSLIRPTEIWSQLAELNVIGFSHHNKCTIITTFSQSRGWSW